MKRPNGGMGKAAALVLPVLATVLLAFLDPMPLRALRDIVFDGYQRLMPRPFDTRAAVRIVEIDDESIARLGQWPWPRDLLATVLDRIAEARPAAIGVDILMAEPDRWSFEQLLNHIPAVAERDAFAQAVAQIHRPHDEELARALAQAPAVLGAVLSDNARGDPPPVKAAFGRAGDDPRPLLPSFSGAVSPLPILVAPARGLGALNWTPDRDLVIRRVPLLFTVDGEMVPSLALEMLRVAQGASTILVRTSNASGETAFGRSTGINAVRTGAVTVATDADSSLRIHYAGSRPERRIPVWRLLDGSFDPQDLAGRLVLVGTSASALADIRATPLDSAVPGVEIHAETLEQLLAGGALFRPDLANGAELVASLALAVLVWLAALRLHPWAAAGCGLLVAALIVAASWTAFAHAGLLLDPGLPMACAAGVYVASTLHVYRRSEGERRWIKQAFARYVSPEIVERLASQPGQLRLGGETRNVTVLFSDVRGFTSLSEDMPAEQVIHVLNQVHTPLTAEVLRQRGTIDKYLGDGLMAFWNAPVGDPDHAVHACRAALAMTRSLPDIERRLADLPSHDFSRQPLRLGISLNTGPASVGNIGSDLRFDYSAVGDTINVAARLDEITKLLAQPVVATETVVDSAPGFVFVPLVVTRLRGRRGESLLFALAGEAPAPPAFAAFLRDHLAAFDAVLTHAPDARARVAALTRHPQAADYAEVYRRWLLALDGAGDMVPEASSTI